MFEDCSSYCKYIFKKYSYCPLFFTFRFVKTAMDRKKINTLKKKQ